MNTKLYLHVETDSSAGFCFGVTNAIKKAEEALQSENPLYCLGDIVHNEEENNRLQTSGLQTIQHSQLPELENQTILFRAHGEPPESYEAARKNQNHIIDATCPIVTALQKQVELSHQNGEHIYLYGKATHPEVIGIAGYIRNDLVVFNEISELNLNELPRQITLYSQTTQSIDKFIQIINELQQAGISVKVKNTICRSVANRKGVLQAFCKRFDKIIFVAGKHSSNGKFLYHICQESNPLSYFISKIEDIDIKWFSPNDTIGISGATSTPIWLLMDVRHYLEKL